MLYRTNLVARLVRGRFNVAACKHRWLGADLTNNADALGGLGLGAFYIVLAVGIFFEAIWKL